MYRIHGYKKAVIIPLQREREDLSVHKRVIAKHIYCRAFRAITTPFSFRGSFNHNAEQNISTERFKGLSAETEQAGLFFHFTYSSQWWPLHYLFIHSLLSFFCARHRCPGAGPAGAASVREGRAAPLPQPFQPAPMEQDMAEPHGPHGDHWETQLNTGQNTAWERGMGRGRCYKQPHRWWMRRRSCSRRQSGDWARRDKALSPFPFSSLLHSLLSPLSSLERPVDTLHSTLCTCTSNGMIRKQKRRKRAERPRVSAVGEGSGLGRGRRCEDSAGPSCHGCHCQWACTAQPYAQNKPSRV